MERYPGDGAAAKGFGRCSLCAHEARVLWEAGYPAPPDVCCPHGWVLSAGGRLVPPVPRGQARQAEIYRHYWEVLSPKELNYPAWDPDHTQAWSYEAVPPATDDFAEAWSVEEYRRGQAERARRLGLFIDLEGDESGEGCSSWGGDPGQSCSTMPPPKQEPSDYATAMYRCLGLGGWGRH